MSARNAMVATGRLDGLLWLYAKGVGAVLALDISDGDHREELVRFTRGK